MKIVDCFMFYNELDILKIRLTELYDVVDYFVLVEATGTHSKCKAKPLYYSENKAMFEKYSDKIIHIVTDYNENFSFAKHIRSPNDHWFRENYQRECISEGLKKLSLSDDDIVIISDADEIPNRNVIQAIRSQQLVLAEAVYSLEMTLYYYNIELTTPRKWYHAKIVNYGVCKKFNLLTDIRMSSNYILIRTGGFHLSYYGSVEFIKTKVESFAESTEYTDAGKQTDHLRRCYNDGVLHFNNEKLVHIPLATNSNVPLFFKQ